MIINYIVVKQLGLRLLHRYRIGRNSFWKTDNGNLPTSALCDKTFLIKCSSCNRMVEVKTFIGGKTGFMHKKYLCKNCWGAGERNPFYGKRHPESFKLRLSSERSGIWGVGEKNAMYGKNVWDTYSDEKAKIVSAKISASNSGKNNHFYGKVWTEQDRRIKAESSRRWLIDHPEHLAKMVRNSLSKQRSGFKSSIERSVECELKKRHISFVYSKILHRRYQYDFIINGLFLLEVNGDYWHANPKYYGDKKIPLTKTQKYKLAQDKIKKQYAEEYGYRLFYIWESDIKNGDFSVIDKLEYELRRENETNKI